MDALLLALVLVQDPATEWMDRVAHDLVASRGPLPRRPLKHTLHLGVLSWYEDNVNLEEDDTDGGSVVMPFLGLRLEYSERQVEAAADALFAWKQYIPDGEYSDDEERVYARLRFIGPRLEVEFAEIFQHLSDPVDAVFADRIDRFVSDTLGRARMEAGSGIAVEADVAFGILRAQEKDADDADNWNLRAGAGTAVRLSSAMEAVAQAGFLLVDYRYATGAPPDVDGLYARAGLRGDLLPTLSLTALAGVGRVESDDFSDGRDGKDDDTGEAAVHLAFQATPALMLYGDYSRQIVFGAGTDPYQILNRWIVLAEYEASPEVRLRGRVQLDHADSALGVEREWASAGGSVQWQSHEQVYFDAGLTFRWGSVDAGASEHDYEDMVVHFGLVITN